MGTPSDGGRSQAQGPRLGRGELLVGERPRLVQAGQALQLGDGVGGGRGRGRRGRGLRRRGRLHGVVGRGGLLVVGVFPQLGHLLASLDDVNGWTAALGRGRRRRPAAPWVNSRSRGRPPLTARRTAPALRTPLRDAETTEAPRVTSISTFRFGE